MKGKIAYHTLGCKLNFSETSAISRKLSDKGFQKVEIEEEADYYVINTCSVTENANKKCRALARKLKRQSPNSKIVFIGCYAQLKPEEIAEIPDVSMVLGAKEKFELDKHLEQLQDTEEVIIENSPVKQVDFYSPAYSIADRTRSFLKVQDGCDYFCSFCTIPLARGRSRSASIADVIKQAEEIAKKGVKEIVLTGVNTGDFGRTEDGKRRSGENFTDLVKALSKVKGIERWRISSIEPNLISSEIIDVVANAHTFMPHFHIPLQSGSDRILKLMRRKYDTKFYQDKIEEIRNRIPDVCFGIDVIVGFPGEGDKEFLETYEFLKAINPAYLHVFTYSERLNTKAMDMTGSIPKHIRRERSDRLRSLSNKLQRDYYSKYTGSKRAVLFEAGKEGEKMYGFTDNYIKVEKAYEASSINKIEMTELKQLNSEGIFELVSSQPKVEMPV